MTYTIKDLAEQLPVTANQLAKWCMNKYIPYQQKNYGIGGTRTFSEADREYIEHFVGLVAGGTRPKAAKEETVKHFRTIKFQDAQ